MAPATSPRQPPWRTRSPALAEAVRRTAGGPRCRSPHRRVPPTGRLAPRRPDRGTRSGDRRARLADEADPAREFTGLQGIQALALTAPLFLLIFANGYHLLAHHVPGSFTEPLTRTDALYFAVTVFATVGFGDLAPVTQTARVLVTVQMVGNLLVLGVAPRVIVTAVRRTRHRGDRRPRAPPRRILARVAEFPGRVWVELRRGVSSSFDGGGRTGLNPLHAPIPPNATHGNELRPAADQRVSGTRLEEFA
ncbi:potassium channel family protein [Amycolatopsis magusensis]|uniref:potassium channel family protein n=1 Tax=Amycolatopsis magusensis TaxID=882444 RepID=UPI00378CA607